MAETRSLHKKLAQVMYEAERIPKNGTAPAAMGGFKFVQVGDAADVIRRALAEKGVSMIPTAVELVGEVEHPTSSGKMMTTLTVRTTWTLTDGDSGESTVIQSLGSGADMGDKAAPKAQSNAMKYALLMGFLLSTGDDPEMTDSSDRRSERNPRPGAPDYEPPTPPTFQGTPDGGMIGVAEAGKADADFELRLSPDDDNPDGPGIYAIAFRLVSGRKSFKVIAEGDVAEQIGENRADIEGKTITAWGRVSEETFQPEGTRKKIPYTVLYLSRITAGDLVLPAVAPASKGQPTTDTPGATGHVATAPGLSSGPTEGLFPGG